MVFIFLFSASGNFNEEFRECFHRLINIPVTTPVTFYDHAAIVELIYPMEPGATPQKIKSYR